MRCVKARHETADAARRRRCPHKLRPRIVRLVHGPGTHEITGCVLCGHDYSTLETFRPVLELLHLPLQGPGSFDSRFLLPHQISIMTRVQYWQVG